MGRKGKSTIFYISFLLFVCIGIINKIEKPQAASGEVTLQAECGYDGYGKFGRNIPFFAEVISTKSFQGILRVIVPANKGEENYAYEYPITAEEGSSLQIRGEIPLVSNYTSISFQVISEKNQVLAEMQAKVKISGREVTELYVGVLSENPDASRAFSKVNVGEYTDSSFPYVKTRAFALKREDIEDIHYGLDCLDIIVVDRWVASALTEKQKDTLYNWVSEGGALVVEVRSGQYMFPENIYPITEEVEARPYLWVQTQKVKKGKCGYFNLRVEDMDLMEFAVDNNAIPGTVISKVCSAESITKIIEQDHYYNGEYTWQSVKELLDTAMGRKLPNISIYVGIILIYLILAGPVVFYVLRKKDKAGLTGIAVSVLAVGFSVIIYLVGTTTRFQEPIIRYASIWTLDGRLVSEESYLDTKAPNSSPYQLKISSDYSIEPVSSSSHFSYETVDKETILRDYKIEMYYDKEDTTLTMRKPIPFESQYFRLEREWEDKELLGLRADLMYFNETLSGRVYNDTQNYLENVILVLRNCIYMLDYMEPGKVVDVSEGKKIYFYPSTCEAAAREVTGFDSVVYEMDSENKEYAVLSQKTRLLTYCLEQLDINNGVGAVLFAFYTPEQSDGFQKDIKIQTYGATILSKTIGLDTSMGGLVYQNLAPDEIVNIDDDISYNKVTGSTYSASIRLQYELGSMEELRAIRIATAEVSPDNQDYQAFSGEMYFYNPLTLAYEQINLDRKNFWITDMEKYLTGRDGRYSLIVQYSSDILDAEQYKEIVLPIVSVIKKK